MYQIKNYTAEISIKEYLNKYVDIPTFLKCCRECPNFNHKWSCPPYDFDVESYWKQYTSFLLVGRQIIFNEETRNRTFSQEDMDLFIEEIVAKEKQILTDQLFDMEKENASSISLSAGSCAACGKGNCTRPSGGPCRHPEKMRYSIESLGGNVGKTISDLFHIELEWVEEGKLPSHFVLVCGLLKP
ncbi:MAG: DUF2284 domain-containing protein [Lachnospiraceae bacterium]|nr:DUF2284 domain-containing protein [Lachnospiraceae bacterium]MEE1249037.1 DUF2284 domain-containing protein [Lachnospiraceae bacterium]